MMHSEIEDREFVERYVRNQLAPEERQAFEEHFFGCQECFEKLQDAERFNAGVRDAARRGLLSDEMQSRSKWMVWAFAGAACAALVFAVITAWTYVALVPRLRGERDGAASKLQAEQQSQTRLSRETARVEQAEANIPLVMLQATRSAEEPAAVSLPPQAKHLVLWIEIGPSHYREFRVEVFTPENHLVTSVDHLTRSPYGGLAASLPADQLPTATFLIKLTGENPPPAALAGEYK
ncbi:MAG TPA: zf-HC2 domain-containing protein, partial [Terriglobia bacterium]|nr:zf-HC2 domain-containing protein [Terriglobia bacterium]